MRLTGIIEGQAVTVDIDHETGRVSFRSEVLGGDKRYDSPERIAAALRRWDLDQRKNFCNPSAFVVQRGYVKPAVVGSVTVTSVDSSGTEAWIKSESGKREKISIESLYANREEVEGALRVEAERKKAVDDAWAGVTRWKPEQAKGGAADGN